MAKSRNKIEESINENNKDKYTYSGFNSLINEWMCI